MSTKKYIIFFREGIIEIKMKPITIQSTVLSVLAILLPFALFLILSCIAFLNDGYFYAILFLALSILMVSAVIAGTVQTRKRVAKFSFVLDGQGIKHMDVDTTYHIAWENIVSWGYVYHNVISGIRNTPHSLRQICLYFSRNLHEETFLRKRFDRMGNRRYMHCSTAELVVFGFHEDNIEGSLIQKLNDCICIYCDQSKQADYI